MPYRRFLREQNIYVPSNINPNLQSPPPTQGQLYQSPPSQPQVYHTPSPQFQAYQSPPAQIQIVASPPTQVQLYQSPPQQIHFYTSPSQQSPQSQQQQFQPQSVEMVGNYQPPPTGLYSTHGLGQPLPPGVLGRAPRNGNIVQQHTHYPFAPQQQQQNVNVPIQPQVPAQQVFHISSQNQTRSNTYQQPAPAAAMKKRKLTADSGESGRAQLGGNAGSVGQGDVNAPASIPPRPPFEHQPASSSSIISEDPGVSSSSAPIRNEGNTQQQQQVSEEGKKLAQKKGKKPGYTGSTRGPKEKHKAKACIYCRRSHMVCDHERPCARCIKRGIENLCVEDGLHQTAASSSRAQASGHESEDPSSKRSQSPGEGSNRRKRQKSSSSGLNGPSDAIKAEPIGGTAAQPNSLDFWSTNQETRTSGSQGDGMDNALPPATLKARMNLYNMSGAEGPAGTSDTGNLHSTGMPLPPAWPLLPGDGTAAEKIDIHMSHLKGNPTLSSGPEMDLSWPTTDVTATEQIERDTAEDLAGGNGSGPSYASGIPSVNEPLHGARATDLPPQATVTNYGTTATERLSRQVQGGEFGVLSDFLESLGIPSLPGGLGDIFGDNRLDLAGLGSTVGVSGGLGDGFGNAVLGDLELSGQDRPAVEMEQGNAELPLVKVEEDGLSQPILPKASKAEKYFLAAADQASGTRDERLAKVIKAKYEAGLLKPYDYSRGYAKMYKWLEKNVPSPATRQAILRPLSVFRPAFRAISQTLSDIDLVFVEEAFERLMLDYDRVFSAIHTPACLWRRTGEIYKANKEFSVLTGIPSALLRGGKIGIYELMSEESMVQYYQLFGSIAFDSGRKSLHTTCTLRIPDHLTRVNASSTTPLLGPAPPSTSNTPTSSPKTSNFALPASLMMTRTESQPGSVTPNQAKANATAGGDEGVRTVKCCFSFTIRRDSYGFPTAIVGNFIPS